MDSKELIKNNANNILKKNDRYYIVGTVGKKAGLLSSSNSKDESKKEAINKLKEKFNFNDVEKLNLVMITLRKVTKEEKELDEKSEHFTLVGGPLVLIIEDLDLNPDSLKIKKVKSMLGNFNKIFVDNKFLKKNKNIDHKLIQKLGFKYVIKELEGGISMNKISYYI